MLPLVTIEGRMVADPELKFSPSGVAVGSFRVVASSRKQVDGEWVDDKTLWMPVTCFKQLAENVVDSLKKGDLVVVVGRIQTDEWETQDGEKKSRVVMIADDASPSLKFRRTPHGGAAAVERRSSSAGDEDQWSGGQAASGQDDQPPFR